VLPGACRADIGIPLGAVTLTLPTSGLSGFVPYVTWMMYIATIMAAWVVFGRLLG
jgi:hypothetical protein